MDTLVFLPRHLEPCKVVNNPRWYPYTKGAPQTGNSIDSRGTSRCASGASLLASSQTLLVVFTIKLTTKTPWALFPFVHDGDHITNAVRKTLTPLCIIVTAHARAEGFYGFF
jgi:hypothetical protein